MSENSVSSSSVALPCIAVMRDNVFREAGFGFDRVGQGERTGRKTGDTEIHLLCWGCGHRHIERRYPGFLYKMCWRAVAHQLSSFIYCPSFSVYVWVLEGRWKLSSSYAALAIGLIWLVQTIYVRISVRPLWMGHSWTWLFADYNVFEGRFWSIVVSGSLLPR